MVLCSHISNMTTADLIFSYWLDAWFIAWLIIIQYKHVYAIPNPAVFLAGGLAQNWWFLSRMFYKNTPTKWLYLGQSVLFKLIPLCYAVYKFPRLHEITGSLKFGGGLMLVYTAYLWFRGTTPWKLYSDMNKSILSGETKTPFMRLATMIMT